MKAEVKYTNGLDGDYVIFIIHKTRVVAELDKCSDNKAYLQEIADKFNSILDKHVQSALSSKITAIKEKFGFTYYRTKYPTDIALILEIERDQILNELKG